MPLEIKNAEWIAVEQVGRVLAAIPARVGGLYLIVDQEQNLIASHGVERGLKHTLEDALIYTPQAAFFWYRVNEE